MTTDKTPQKRSRGRPKTSIKNPADYDTIEALVTAGKGKTHIARVLNMTPKTFNGLLKRDNRAAEALQAGVEAEYESVCLKLREQAEDKTNPRSIQAAALLLKVKHNVQDTPAPSVQINLPAPMAAKDYEKLVQGIPKQPAAIEHVAPEKKEPATFAQMIKRSK